MESVSGGTFITACSITSTCEQMQALCIVTKGLVFLHANKISYPDMKPVDPMFHEDGHPLIGDFDSGLLRNLFLFWWETLSHRLNIGTPGIWIQKSLATVSARDEENGLTAPSGIHNNSILVRQPLS